MDELILSRIQFAANITFHILFPMITIALGWVLLFFKLRYQVTRDYKWMELYFFFTKIFALSFSLGVVSGVTMSFQFGTNWPGYMNTVGNVAGPLLAYEVLTAFFLEATFLGIMLFAFRRVPPWLHTMATVLVAVGTTLSAFWILALNSWMHTPQGFTMIDGVAHATSWWQIIFNPSMPFRLVHTLLASGITVAFLMGGLLAFRIIKGDRSPAAKSGMRVAIYIAAILTPLQAVAGDYHGINTRDYQPAKLAAMEALWESQDGAPLLLFAIPDEKTQSNRFEVGIPWMGSLIITRDPHGRVAGLNEFEGVHPPVAPVFFGFRIMVGVGLLMIVVAGIGAYFIYLKRDCPPLLLKAFIAMTFSGWIASVAGWYVTEIGRQPWLVQGILLTKDAVTDLPPSYVGFTLAAYLITYVSLLIAFIGSLYYLSEKAARESPRDPAKDLPKAPVL